MFNETMSALWSELKMMEDFLQDMQEQYEEKKKTQPVYLDNLESQTT